MTRRDPPAWIIYASGGAFLVWIYVVPRLAMPRFLAAMKRAQIDTFATRVASGILGFFVVPIVFYAFARAV
jgi:hypothetical protein